MEILAVAPVAPVATVPRLSVLVNVSRLPNTVIQGVALWMIFLTARWISTSQPPIRRTNDLTT